MARKDVNRVIEANAEPRCFNTQIEGKDVNKIAYISS